MEKSGQRPKGRPVMDLGKRSRKVDVRFTAEEFEKLRLWATELGVSRTELVRMRVLEGSGRFILNSKEVVARLAFAGTELARIGNNINQLARYANILHKKGLLSPQVIERYNQLLANYTGMQELLAKEIRRVIRSLKR